MKFTTQSLVILTLLLAATAARAQLVTRYYTVHGDNTNVVAQIIETVNSTANTVTIQIDNTILGTGNAMGTITSFGFNTPFTGGQLGTNGNNVSFTQSWTKLVPGHSQPAKWAIDEPYTIAWPNNEFSEDFGVGTTSSNPATGGIRFGEKATFVFTFPNFSTSDIAGFFDSNFDFTLNWKDLANCGTDKDLGYANDLTSPPGTTPPAPEPSTYGMMGAASLLGLALWRRRATKIAAAKNVAA